MGWRTKWTPVKRVSTSSIGVGKNLVQIVETEVPEELAKRSTWNAQTRSSSSSRGVSSSASSTRRNARGARRRRRRRGRAVARMRVEGAS